MIKIGDMIKIRDTIKIRVVKYVKFSPKSTAYLVSEKSTRIFLKKYVNHHQYSNFKIKILGC